MKPQRRRALKGRRATPAASSVEELTGVSISRRHAYEAGHQAALFDEPAKGSALDIPVTRAVGEGQSPWLVISALRAQPPLLVGAFVAVSCWC